MLDAVCVLGDAWVGANVACVVMIGRMSVVVDDGCETCTTLCVTTGMHVGCSVRVDGREYEESGCVCLVDVCYRSGRPAASRHSMSPVRTGMWRQ